MLVFCSHGIAAPRPLFTSTNLVLRIITLRQREEDRLPYVRYSMFTTELFPHILPSSRPRSRYTLKPRTTHRHVFCSSSSVHSTVLRSVIISAAAHYNTVEGGGWGEKGGNRQLGNRNICIASPCGGGGEE